MSFPCLKIVAFFVDIFDSRWQSLGMRVLDTPDQIEECALRYFAKAKEAFERGDIAQAERLHRRGEQYQGYLSIFTSSERTGSTGR
jgi:hypothetical protein